MSFPCPTCGAALVNSRRRDVVYEMTGRFSTLAYLFPRVFCPNCARELAGSEWPEDMKKRFRSFRLKYVLFGIGLIGVIVFRIFVSDLAAWWLRRHGTL